jgi:membrane protein implicated in regulation of membrane protease activity
MGSAAWGFAAASVLCVLYIVAGRRWVRARLKRPGLPTNTDALIGQRALVTQALSPLQPGQVRLHSEVWRARPAADEAGTLEAGTEVMVEGVDGVTLLVRRMS